MEKIIENYGKRVVWLAAVGFIAILLGLLLAFSLEPKELGWKVIIAGIAELGFAAIIAVFIVVTLDRHEKEKAASDHEAKSQLLTERGFASAISGLRLPDEISDHLKDLLVGQKAIKTYHIQSYSLERQGDGMVLHARDEFEISNASKERITFRLPVYTNRLAGGDYILKIEKKDEFEQWREISISKKSNPGDAVFETQDEIPVELDSGESFKACVILMHQKELSDSHLWTNLTNSRKFKCTLTYEPSEVNLAIRLTSSFEKDYKTAGDEVGTVTIEHNRPFFRGNSSYVAWTPKS